MSKLKALVLMLVVGASSSALADHTPSPAVQGSAQLNWGARDDRFDNDRRWWPERSRTKYGPRSYRHSWVALSQPMQLVRGREVIDVDARGTFTQLRLQTTSGATHIDRVLIRFADGSRQVANLDRTLSVRNPILQVALDGNNRRIDRIIVLGDSRRNASIQVFGI